MPSFLFLWAVLVASVGSGFQHGWNIAILNAPQRIIIEWIQSLNLSYLPDDETMELYWSVIASIFTVGGVIGGMAAPLFIMIMKGPKGGLIANGLIAILGGALMFLTKTVRDPTILMVGRVVAGINSGMNGGLCPIFLIEISPVNLRGAVGSLYQLFLTFALFLGIVISLEPVLGGKDTWEWLFSFQAFVGLIQMIFLLWIPESPVYLLEKKGDEVKARKAFDRLHGKRPTADQEFAQIKAASEAAKAEPKITVKIFFSQKTYVKPLMICIFLMTAQQMSGINAVMFYSTEIFRQNQMTLIQAQLCTASIGLVNFVATVVAVAVIEKIGRKPLLVWGFIVMAISTAVLMGMLYLTNDYVWSRYACLVAILIFIVAFAVGAGPIPWIFGSEVFLSNARPIAYAFIIPTSWIFNLLVALCFPTLQRLMGPLVFLIFLTCQVVSVVIILIFVPETKNRNTEDIIKQFA